MQTPQGIELKPCPFCGNAELEAETKSGNSSDYIMCVGEHGCGAMISRGDTPDGNLIAAWNRRRAIEAPPTNEPVVTSNAATILCLMNEMMKHPQLKSVIGREALILRCVAADGAARPTGLRQAPVEITEEE